MPRVDGVFDEVPEFEQRRRAATGAALAELFERYRDVFAVSECAPHSMILVPRDRDAVSPAEAEREVMWHGDAYVAMYSPTTTKADPGTLEQRLAEAIAELEAPVDPRVWATTPEPCARPATVEPPPLRWSRPLRMWP